MSNDWKTDRAEAAIKEGTDKIMKAAQEQAKHENVESIPLPEEDLPYIDEEIVEPKSFEICLGVGMNQFFPDYVTINLTEDGSNEA
jgi:hypothetical protein